MRNIWKICLLFCSLFLITSKAATVVLAQTEHLSKGYVTPGWTVAGDEVNYCVYYQHADGDAPGDVTLHLGSEVYAMEPVSGSYEEGMLYSYSLKIPDSWQKPVPFYFTSTSGSLTFRFPEGDAVIAGPTILESRFDNNKIAVFDATTGTQKWVYSTGKDWIRNISLSNNGRYLGVKTTDKIYFFSTESSKPLWEYTCQKSNQGENRRYYAGWVAVSKNSEFVAGGCQNVLHIFNKSGRIVWSYPARINKVANSADGFFTAVATLAGGADQKPGQTILFSNATRKPIWNHFANGHLTAVAVSEKAEYIASGDHFSNSVFYNFLRSGPDPLLAYSTNSSAPVSETAVSSDGMYSFYAVRGQLEEFGNVFVYSVADKEFVQTYNLGGSVYGLSISDNGSYLAAGGANSIVKIWNRNLFDPVWQHNAGSNIGAVAISDGGNALFYGSKSGRLDFVKAGREGWSPKVEIGWSGSLDNPINAVSVSGDGAIAAAGTGPQKYIDQPYIPEYDAAGVSTMCGDGVCSPLWGENKKTCPQDCGDKEDGSPASGNNSSARGLLSFLNSPPLQLAVLLPALLVITAVVIGAVTAIFKLLRKKKQSTAPETEPRSV